MGAGVHAFPLVSDGRLRVMGVPHTCLCALLRKPNHPMQHCTCAVQPEVTDTSELHDAQACFLVQTREQATAVCCAGSCGGQVTAVQCP